MSSSLDTENFGRNLDRLMSRVGMNNSHLAAAVEVSREIVRQWRSGAAAPSEPSMIQLPSVFHCKRREFHRPLYAVNLAQMMSAAGIDTPSLARQLEVTQRKVKAWCASQATPNNDELRALAKLFDCAEFDLLGIPVLLPITKWAAREGIPTSRARDMVMLNLIPATTTEFNVLVPAEVTAPNNSKAIVTRTKLRPKWGIDWQWFPFRLSEFVAARMISRTEFAARMNVAVPTVIRWCNGERQPDEELIPVIAQTLRCRQRDLFRPLPPLPDLSANHQTANILPAE